MILALLLAATLDEYFAPYSKRGALAVAIVQDGKPAAIRAYGSSPDDAFRLASLSKVVTALAVVKSGADLHAPTRYGVTLHQLLTHTSGIDDAFFGNTVPVEEDVTLAEHFRRRPPRFGRAAGEVVVYSNEGMTLAGHLIENGRRFEEVVQKTVLEPLAMTHSTFMQPPPFPVIPSGAENERLVQSPAGAMIGTAGDMARLMVFLLSDDPAAVTMRANRYGLFELGGAYFHTGRSGHESVLYLSPKKRLGLFLVHTGGLGRDLRRNFVRDFGGWELPKPRSVQLDAGIYRPFLLPTHRIESAARLATDTSVRVDASTITVRMPPFATGQQLVFENGVTKDSYVLTGEGRRFTITGPLFEPVTFERIAVSGRAQLIAAAVAFVVMLAGGRKFLIAGALFALVPITFFAFYRFNPFFVEAAVNRALIVLGAAVLAAFATPFMVRKSGRRRHVVAAVAAITLGIWLSFFVLLETFRSF